MKRTTLRISAGAVAAALIFAGIGFAAEEHSHADQPETRAEAQERAGHLFDRLDLNHDGKLDQADRSMRMSKMFDRLDTNHDGVISRAEFIAAHEHMMGPGHGGPGPGMARHAMDGEHPGGHDGHMGHWGYNHRELGGLMMLIMQRADPGHTGAITRDAFVGAALSLFDQADTNHDHVLSPEEHRAYAEAMHRQMGMHGDHHDGPGAGMPPPTPSGN